MKKDKKYIELDRLQKLIYCEPLISNYRETIVDEIYHGYRYIIGFYYNHAVAYVIANKYVDTDYLYQPHGGFTYSDDLCPFDTNTNYTIGWDYGHAGDFMRFRDGHVIDGRIWSIGDITEECKAVIDSFQMLD